MPEGYLPVLLSLNGKKMTAACLLSTGCELKPAADAAQ
jgi:hypothetical protein